jgi:hypothetical protein
MKSFRLTEEDDYERIYISKLYDLKVAKTNSRCTVYVNSRNLPIAEMIGATNKEIVKRIKLITNQQ